MNIFAHTFLCIWLILRTSLKQIIKSLVSVTVTLLPLQSFLKTVAKVVLLKGNYWVGQKVRLVLSKNKKRFSFSRRTLLNVFTNRMNFLANPIDLNTPSA